MEHRKYLSFYGKNEYTFIREHAEQYGLGKLMFAFWDVNWQDKQKELTKLRKACFVKQIDQDAILDISDNSKNYIVVAAYYKTFYDELNALHPFLGQTIDEMLEETVNNVMPPHYAVAVDTMLDLFRHSLQDRKTIDRLTIFQEQRTKDFSLVEATNEFLVRLCALTKEMARFKEDLLEICTYALDRESEQSNQKPIERYYSMQEESYQPFIRVQQAAGLPHVEQRVIREDDLESGKDNCVLIAHSFFTAVDIRTLIFAEYQYMCANNHVISKCQYCNRYFRPHSKASIYCDRLADEASGKACKEFASADKYLRQVSANEAKVLYGRYRNSYQMRVRRNPDDFPYSEYAAWMDRATLLLKKVKAGRMSIEEFDRKIALPSTKEARNS